MGLSLARDAVPHGGAIGMKKTALRSILSVMKFALLTLDRSSTIHGPTRFLHCLWSIPTAENPCNFKHLESLHDPANNSNVCGTTPLTFSLCLSERCRLAKKSVQIPGSVRGLLAPPDSNTALAASSTCHCPGQLTAACPDFQQRMQIWSPLLHLPSFALQVVML